MNRAKFIISFLLGAGVGGLLTWKLLEAHYEGILQDELDSIEAKLLKDREKKDRGHLVQNEYENVKKRYNIEEQRAEDVDPDEEEVEEEVEFPDDYATPPVYDTFPVPYPISEQEFSEECLNYDKLSLKYYMEDEVLCDDQEVPVDDILQLVGEETQDYLVAFANNKHPGDLPNPIYIRAEGTTCDYEITIVENSYASEVLGYENPNHDKKKNGPPPRKVAPKDKSKRTKGNKVEDSDDE